MTEACDGSKVPCGEAERNEQRETVEEGGSDVQLMRSELEKRSQLAEKRNKKRTYQVTEQVKDGHEDAAEYAPQELDSLGACTYTPIQEERQDGERNSYHKHRLKQDHLDEQGNHLGKRKMVIKETDRKDGKKG